MTERNDPEILTTSWPITIQPDKPIDQSGTSTDKPINQRGTSTDKPIDQSETSTDCNASMFTISPNILQPLPKVTQGKKRVSRGNRWKAAILTSSPYKTQLEAAEIKSKKNFPTTQLIKKIF